MRTVLIAFIAAASAFAQQPAIRNAKLETRQVSGGLGAAMSSILGAQTSPAWVGYAVPIVKGDRSMCCYNNGVACGCSLESRSGENIVSNNENRSVKLEGPTHLVVLFRIEDRKIGKLRTFTPECELDAGGLPFLWLNGVQPPDSVHYLATVVRQLSRPGPAVAAIALHADPAADQTLESLVAPAEPESIRRAAVFWLGVARGAHGYQVLQKIVRDDPSDKVREHAIFALTQSKEPGALDTIIRTAHEDKSPRVRGQALFWLAHKAGQKAAAEIQNSIQNDPETEVKKRAVFALTQMPNGEGIPRLIEVARTNRNPEVRKQAMFWLGQSKDSRALAFVEQVLTR